MPLSYPATPQVPGPVGLVGTVITEADGAATLLARVEEAARVEPARVEAERTLEAFLLEAAAAEGLLLAAAPPAQPLS